MTNLWCADIRANSAGTHALSAEPMDPHMRAILDGRADGDGHRAQQLNRELVAAADLVLALDAEHRRYVLDEWPDLGTKAFVIGHAARELGAAPGGLERAAIRDYLSRHRTVDPSDGVADPYGKGPSAARECARTIDGFLRTIINRLSHAGVRE